MKVNIHTSTFFGVSVTTVDDDTPITEIMVDNMEVDLTDYEELSHVIDILENYKKEFNDAVEKINLWLPIVSGTIVNEASNKVDDIIGKINDLIQPVKTLTTSESLVNEFIDEKYSNHRDDVKAVMSDLLNEFAEWLLNK